MAETSMDYIHATEKILEWYHTLRVDHLSQSEIDFELDIRAIVIRDDPTYSRSRRSLRDHLKLEKENHRTIEVTLDVNWEETIQFCRRFYDEIIEGFARNDKNFKVRGQAKLLHFGHRIVLLLHNAGDSGEVQHFLKGMLVEVVKLLKQYYFTKPVESGTRNQEDLDGQSLINLFQAPPTSTAVTGSETSVAGASSSGNIPPEDTHIFRCLLARIQELNTELEKKGKQLEEQVQKSKNEAPSGNQQPFVQMTSSNNSLTTTYPTNSQCLPATSNSRPITSTTFSIPQSYPTVLPQPSTSWHNHLLTATTAQPLGTQFPNLLLGHQAGGGMPVSNPLCGTSYLNNVQPSNILFGMPTVGNIPPTNSWLGAAAFNNVQAPNPWLGNASAGYTHPSNPWIGTQVPSSNTQANPTFTSFNPIPQGNPMRHTLPVSKWTIPKYDGEDQGLKLNQFLVMVHTMAVAEHVSDVELFESAIHLFKGPALQWYMTMRTTGRLVSWQHLVLELRRTFMHPDLDTLIKMKVYQRHQFRNETFLQYYHSMEELFGTMSVPLPDYEKKQILLQNMRIDYKKQLNFLPIADLPTLVAAGQKIDAINFSVYNKVFGPEKSVNAVDSSRPSTKPNNDLLVQKHDKKSSQQPPVPSHPLNTNPSRSQNHQNRKESQTRVAATHESTRSTTTLEQMIESHQPLSSQHCFNCGKFGHHMDRCMLPKGVLCEKCGFRGYPSNNCPYCIKNALAASQNRRSLNPNF